MNRRALQERENGPWEAEQSDYYFFTNFQREAIRLLFFPVTNFIWSLIYFRRAFSRNYKIPSRSARAKLAKKT